MIDAVLEPARALVVHSGAPGEPRTAGSFFRGELAWSWGFCLEPVDASATRRIIRSRASWERTSPAAFARGLGLEPDHLAVEEGMPREICGLAEEAAREAWRTCAPGHRPPPPSRA
jgi:hypothetical protein